MVKAAAAPQFGYSKRLAGQEIGQLRNRSESAWQINRGQLGEPRCWFARAHALAMPEISC
jgi:hypothetical protein